MRIGFTTIDEADNFLLTWYNNESWQFASSAPKLTGTFSQGSLSTLITGVNSLFTTELAVNDYVDIDNQILQVKTIHSDTSITVYPQCVITSGANGYKITGGQAIERAAIYLDKIKLLSTAYNRIAMSPYHSIPSDTTSDKVKYAQTLQALNIKSVKENPSVNIHSENIENGITSYSLGDSSYTYGNSSSSTSNIFSSEVNEYLTEFSNYNRIFKLNRGSMESPEFPSFNPESLSIILYGYRLWL